MRGRDLVKNCLLRTSFGARIVDTHFFDKYVRINGQNGLRNWFTLMSYGYRYDYDKLVKQKWKGYVVIREGLYHYEAFNFCYLNNMLANCLDILSKGYVPIIDLSERNEGENNWEMFFEQPFAKENLNMMSEKKLIYWDYRAEFWPGFQAPYDELQRNVWMKLYRDFMAFNDETKQYIENEYQKLIQPEMRVLGVLVRGTDYITQKPKDHPIQPSLEEVISTAKKKMSEYSLEYIYLATEEEAVSKVFRETFPGKVIENKRHYYDRFYSEQAEWIDQVKFGERDEIYVKGVEYLSSIYILSKCNALIGGNCGGSCAALFMNNDRYEYCNLFDLGTY